MINQFSISSRKLGKTLLQRQYQEYLHNEAVRKYKVLTGRLQQYGFSVVYFGIRVNRGLCD